MPVRILVTDRVNPTGITLLEAVPGFEVDVLPTLPAEELLERIGEYDAIIGRSATKISTELLRAGRRLRCVGRAGVGVDNVDMDEATRLGIAVINAPAGNTVAVAELFYGAVIGLLRHIPQADGSMHEGRWERSALTGTELKGKTLGIIGVGRIGSEVAQRAQAFGMRILGYDPYVSNDRFLRVRAQRVESLEELLEASDVVTIHTPLTDETRGMLSSEELGHLRDGSVLVNMARGGIIDEDALAVELERGRLRGAVLDVYAAEPMTGHHAFRDRDDVVLTPHLGASTLESQHNVAVDVCAGVRDFFLEDDLTRSLNVDVGEFDIPGLPAAITLARRAAAVARALLASRGGTAVGGLTLKIGDDLAPAATVLLSAATAGVLENVVDAGRLNLINARRVAAERGIELGVAAGGVPPHGRALEVRIRAGSLRERVGGVAPVDTVPRLTRIQDFHVDVAPRRTLLVLHNRDVPGVIGHVGTALGDAGVNIAEYHQARLAEGGEALAVVTVDGLPPRDLADELLGLDDVSMVTVVSFHGD
ncbi:MAG: phosphoglycerate dehydrogenase [Gemmatimonadetes bacterium]|nr:phosphoglycerate dehydrogenase [Gemmatimonadota bacterium]